MMKMGDKIGRISEATIRYAEEESWEQVSENMKKIKNLWEDKSLWTALTIKTDELEEIEISLRQSEKYAELRDKKMFLGEFIMFSELVKHIPHQEGFHMEELL